MKNTKDWAAFWNKETNEEHSFRMQDKLWAKVIRLVFEQMKEDMKIIEGRRWHRDNTGNVLRGPSPSYLLAKEIYDLIREDRE